MSDKTLEERAVAVVRAAVDWQHDTEECHFCGFHNGVRLHDQDCPLVEEGFIDRKGERL